MIQENKITSLKLVTSSASRAKKGKFISKRKTRRMKKGVKKFCAEHEIKSMFTTRHGKKKLCYKIKIKVL